MLRYGSMKISMASRMNEAARHDYGPCPPGPPKVCLAVVVSWEHFNNNFDTFFEAMILVISLHFSITPNNI